MRTPLISPNSISKLSVRKSSCFERLFADEDHLHHISQQQIPFTFSSSSLSPGKKPYPGFCTCICFVVVFFIITIVAFALCSNLDTPAYEEKASFSADNEQIMFPLIDKPMNNAMPALRGLGSVYRRSAKVMSELVVAHVSENTSSEDLRLFLRTLHRSGVTARADVVFMFAATKLPSAMVDVIHEENQYFQRLLLLSSKDVGRRREAPSNASVSSPLSTLRPSFYSNATISAFSMDAFRRSGSDTGMPVQPLWGTRNPNSSLANMTENIMPATEWGSMVGFDASELNPEDTLQGFIDNPPLALRRWSCYQMLLGMVRHKFKRILLTDVSGVAVLKDPFLMFRRKVGLYLSMEDRPWGATLGDEWGIHSDAMDVEADADVVASGLVQNNSDLSWSRRQLSGFGGVSAEVSMATAQQRRKGSPRRQPIAVMEAHRRGSSAGKRRRGRKAAPVGGLCEHVYGRQLWSSLEESERRKKLVNSGVFMGSIQQVRGLANTMATEIVKVALERRSRDVFPDSVLLSYLLHKSSSVLGKRVMEHLHLMDNEDSFVHSLTGSQQPSIFMKKTRAMTSLYPMIHANSKSRRWQNTMRAIHRDICSSHVDAMVYPDC